METWNRDGGRRLESQGSGPECPCEWAPAFRSELRVLLGEEAGPTVPTGAGCLGAYLSLLLLGGIDDGGAADLGDLTALAVKGPAADLIPDDVLDEQDPPVEAQGQLVKQLDVLQHVVIRVAAGNIFGEGTTGWSSQPPLWLVLHLPAGVYSALTNRNPTSTA